MEEEYLEPDEISKEELEDSLTRVSGMYKDWFLDYASYVILERAVPSLEDGFKPVQRRILHSMKDLDDGRFNKVANVVGHTMQYHPHGDASIADAMVQIGQKDLLIETQGNWGNILTGDRSAASRYIEARLSKFALEVVFSPKITKWQSSYDGRRKEPINLPVKFPLLLAQGGEGIAVGLSTKILPHNFIELIDSSIKCLKGQKFIIYPDFPTSGIIDISNYNDGLRGGRIKVRARISQLNKNTLVISQIPFTTTTSSLIDTIVKANDNGKIKIKKIEDNTANDVEVLVHLPSGVSPDKTIDGLFAFTSCETSISPLGCVIENNKPLFIGVSEILEKSTDRTKKLLKLELEYKRGDFENQWHYASLERIFIENRIYRDIENVETWEGVIKAISEGLQPFTNDLKREVVEDDVVRLTEIKIKRISKFDIDKAQIKIESIESELEKITFHLNNLTDFAISYYKNLKSVYGKNKKRKTEIRIFDDVDAKKVVVKNSKLYVNREEGFIGTSIRKDEFVEECSDIDDVIAFTEEGKMMVTKVDSKKFIGKNIKHVAVFKKKDKRTVYNMIYRDGKKGTSYIKRFSVTGVTRDKDYDLTRGTEGSKILYFSANPNGEAEIVNVILRQSGSIKKLKWELDFADLEIKGRSSKGNIVTKYTVNKIEFKEKGLSTLKPRKIWFDETIQRLNVENRGELLGEFKADDSLLIIQQNGILKTFKPNLNMHFPEDMIILEKWIIDKPLSAIYFDGNKDRYFIKRFLAGSQNVDQYFIPSNSKVQLEIVSSDWKPVIDISFSKTSKGTKDNLIEKIEELISVKGIKALGNQLSSFKIKNINLIEPIPYSPPEKTPIMELEVNEDVSVQNENVENDNKNSENQEGQTELEF
ncbi:MAG: DNA gyrase/topoisomerase IV subunit A [Flavobacteriaceae bacterium]|nr:DNA gyrase/topoisomerase IV subunit A [Flavobacteriaceae bacterium]MBT4415957.1 DNA gyrase/topoisomerase IV subunit A [Flavobacteriaceae bacterium]MBT5595573.1 DNA gyrase/topoisomerase IV subunit A [Flavobacteriaceae bacterium]